MFICRVVLMVLASVLPAFLFGQSIGNFFSSYDGKKVTLTYDLLHSDTSKRFYVQVFSSTDDFTQPLDHVTGAVGANIKPGLSRQIFWDVLKSLPPDFDKDIVYRIKISLNPLPIKKVEPPAGQKEIAIPAATQLGTKKTFMLISPAFCRRGKKYNIQWQGAAPTDQLVFELTDALHTQKIIGQSTGKENWWTWLVPADIKTGNYTLRATANGKSAEAVTLPLHIRRKTPLIVKALPVLAAGVVVVLITGKKTGDTTLPGPVNPN
ncbi:MAG: hypothetical protein JSS73_14850 [Bacteroidetes bacterium]|nr:hypothetical protein [Bacteroidota bacterium]